MTKSPRPHVTRRASVLAAMTFAAALPACKKAVEVSTSAYIVGPTNDILPVDKDTESRIDAPVLAGAVLIATRLQTNRVKFCSGSLIAGATAAEGWRILTNHHCFADLDAAGKATPTVLPEACTATTVYFGFTGQNAETAPTTGCAPGSLRTDFQGDLAVFTLQKNPPEPFRPLELWDGPDEATDGRQALIVHFPDVEERMAMAPDGGVRLPTAAVTLADCKVVGPFPVSEWDLDRTLPYSLRHTCDLIHGSSGSGLIDAKTGRILGVNWGGIKISYPEGVRTDNVATRAAYAQAFLNDTVDAEVKAAESRRLSSNATLAAARGDGGKDGPRLPGSGKKRCGVVRGAEGSEAASPVERILVLLLLLAPPVAAVTLGRAARGPN